jgi:hypothetical protein
MSRVMPAMKASVDETLFRSAPLMTDFDAG